MKNILLIGADGQLGSELLRIKDSLESFEWETTTIDNLDVCNEEKVKEKINSKTFDFLINCTAYTAVDKAESNIDIARAVNATALEHIGKYSNDKNIKVIHVSTDYVFDGTAHTPYTENTPTKPIGVYGLTKKEGEDALLATNPNSIILRTSWLYSEFGNNFVKTMIKLGKERDELGVIFDQIGTPTYAADLAKAIIAIIKMSNKNSDKFISGIYHYSNEGVASWYDFTIAIHDLCNINCKVKPIETKDYPTPAPRPNYSVLNKAKIKNTYGINVPYWKDSLNVCLDRIIK